MEEIAPGLRRWTSWHDHWEEEVGPLALDTEDGLVLIDPLAPPAELPKPAHVFVTVYWHARATADLKARTWASSRSLRPLANRGVEAADAAHGLPGGIRAFRTARAAEPSTGCRSSGPSRSATSCSAPARSRVRRTTRSGSAPSAGSASRRNADLRESLRPLLDLPVEYVLVSHGAPVVGNGGPDCLRDPVRAFDGLHGLPDEPNSRGARERAHDTARDRARHRCHRLGRGPGGADHGERSSGRSSSAPISRSSRMRSSSGWRSFPRS